jgi:hypothetical protein
MIEQHCGGCGDILHNDANMVILCPACNAFREDAPGAISKLLARIAELEAALENIENNTSDNPYVNKISRNALKGGAK